MIDEQLVVDTDIASRLWDGRLPEALDRFLRGHLLLITPVTLGEAVKGIYAALWPRGRQFDLLEYYEQTFELLEWDAAIPMAYGMLAGLARRRGTVGDNDLWIAAWCLVYQLPLVTMNRRHFEPLERFGLIVAP